RLRGGCYSHVATAFTARVGPYSHTALIVVPTGDKHASLPLPGSRVQAAPRTAAISSITRSGASSFMHLKCPSGHSRAKHGLHSIPVRTTRALAERGGVCSGLDEPYSATTGRPTPAATCISPESLLTTTCARESRSIALARSVLP